MNKLSKKNVKLIAAATALVLLALSIIAITLVPAPASSGSLSDPAPVSDTSAQAAVSEADTSDQLIYAQELLFELECPRAAVGHSFGIAVALSPVEADIATVSWASSDESVATVDQDGKVTAIAPGDAYITARSGDAEYGQWFTVIDPGLVYISPSNEVSSGFAYGNTNESEQMAIIAAHCVSRLEQCGIKTFTASADLNYVSRAAEAVDLGAELYVALQADAASGQSGTSIYYQPFSGKSTDLAFRLYQRIAPISPSEESSILNNGSTAGLDEIMHPYEQGELASVIIGIDSRASVEGARWMVENAETIGREIAESIMDHYAGF